MADSFFAYLARMRYINRWGLMYNTFSENIQEHSHMVAVLAHALAVIRQTVFGQPVDSGAVAVAALFHDAPEIFTGDLPTPVKYFSPQIREAYRQVEEDAVSKLLSTLPEALRPAYAPLLSEDDPVVTPLVKAADKLAAYIKCLEELRAGNGEFRSAAEQTREGLDAMKLAELDYFMETFLPAFSQTLDELQ